MESNELRVGNLVHDYDEELIIVSGISYGDVYSSKLGETPLARIKPIPLTEEWLVKFGFELFHYDFFDKDDPNFEEEDEEESCLVFRIIPKGYKFYYIIDLWVERNDFQVGYMGLDDNVNDSKGVGICNYNYVHQLQNLYFALTGEELNIK
jgi:hypothetical protein